MTTSRRKRIERHLPEEELDDLVADATDHHELRRLIFLKCLYLGDTLEDAAERVGRSDPTGSRWAERWNEGSLDGIMPNFGGGRPPKLEEGEREQLIDQLRAAECWTVGDVQEMLREEFDVTYHPVYLRRLLRSFESVDRAP